MAVDYGFLESNLIRAFPFVFNERSTGIPDWLMVDLRIEIDDGSWDPSRYRVYLAWVTLLGNILRMGFRTDAPSLSDEELVFTRDISADGKFLTEFVESTPLTTSVRDRCGCKEERLCNPNFQGPTFCDEVLCNPLFQTGELAEHICATGFEVPL
ncbi:MAG: hypothetical protein D6800_09005 [Candidatus Zixiibacteriota bacterium]|nr:MAG: hypothetical protein D6800_09005 [candidate division Zixibacteria bacterium]